MRMSRDLTSIIESNTDSQMSMDMVITPKEEKPKRKRTASKPKASEPKPTIDHPEFNLVISDDCDELETKLVVCSNNGSDKKKTLNNARKKRLKRPILLEIECNETSYKINNFALTVDEAKQMINELQRMVDYMEEI
jgi:hypothetical protein